MKLPRILDRRYGVWVYAYYDAAGRPLYIGQTRDLAERNRSHGRLSRWFTEATRCELLGHHSTRLAAIAAERAAIREMAPLYNIHHNVRRAA